MLKNTKIIVAVASVLITGIGASAGAYLATRNNADAAVSSEVMSMAESKTASIDTTPIDEAVSAGIEQINSVVSEAIQQIESKVAEQKQVTSIPVESKSVLQTPEPFDVALSVESPAGFGNVVFTGANISYYENNVTVEFKYSVTTDKKLRPKSAYGVDKNGNRMTMGQFSTTPSSINRDSAGTVTEYSYVDNIISLYGPASEIDLSTVTLTYTFEGYEPVTVTFDIPGL